MSEANRVVYKLHTTTTTKKHKLNLKLLVIEHGSEKYVRLFSANVFFLNHVYEFFEYI